MGFGWVLRGASFAVAGLLAGCGGNGHDVVLGGGSPILPPPPSSEARLASLEISNGTLTPAFDPDESFYLVGPSFFEVLVSVTATPIDPGATMDVEVEGGGPGG